MKRLLALALLWLAAAPLRADQGSDAKGASDALQSCNSQVQQVQASTALSSPSINSFDQLKGQLSGLKPYVDSVVSHLSAVNLPAVNSIASVAVDMQVKITTAQGAITSLNTSALISACRDLTGDLNAWQGQYGSVIQALQQAAQQPAGQQAQAVATAIATFMPFQAGPTATMQPTATPVPMATPTLAAVPTTSSLPPAGNGGLIPGGYVPQPPTPTPVPTTASGSVAPVTPQPFSVRKAPLPLVAGHNGQRVWVANVQTSTVGVFDVATQRFVAQLAVGSNPASLGVDDGDNTVAVANAGSGSVTLLDGRADTVLKTISVGATPAQVLVTHGGIAYVACQDGHSVAIIDLARRLLINSLPLTSRPGRLDQPNSSNQVYVTLPDEDSLAVIDTSANAVVSVVKE